MQEPFKKHASGCSYSEESGCSEQRTSTHIRMSAYDDDPYVDAMLEQFNFSYILSQVKRVGNLLKKVTHFDVLDLEFEDVAEEVHINLWQKLVEKEPIQNYRAYIARMIRNKLIDEARKRTRSSHPQLFSTLEIEDILETQCLIEPGEGMADPAIEFERKWAFTKRIEEVADALPGLPPRQRLAILCCLLTQVGYILQLVKAINVRGISTEVHWPADSDDKKLLKASLYPARIFMAKRLNINLSLYKRPKRVKRRSTPRCNPPIKTMSL